MDDCAICLNDMSTRRKPAVRRARTCSAACAAKAPFQKSGAPLPAACAEGDLIEAPLDDDAAALADAGGADDVGGAGAKAEALVRPARRRCRGRRAGGHKVKAVVFSQFVWYLDIAKAAVDELASSPRAWSAR